MIWIHEKMGLVLWFNMKIKHNYSQLILTLIKWHVNCPYERTMWQLYDQFKGFQSNLHATIPYTLYLVGELVISANPIPNDALMGFE